MATDPINKFVTHPFKGLEQQSDRFLSWLATKVLPSSAMFYAAFVLPLMVLPLSDSVKLVLGLFSGSWIQWWALSALQRTQVLADVKRDLKADADHAALTHLANTQDQILLRLTDLENK